jgi:uncharacterized repeat protein (TIGR03803 family)
MKTQFKTLHNGSQTSEIPGSRSVLALPVRPSSFSLYPLGSLKRLLWVAPLLLPVFGVQAAAVLTTLYSFTGANDGANPAAGLVQGSDGYFYGTTANGGAYGYADAGAGDGTVFKMSTNGALTTLYAFGSVTNANGDGLDGANPYAGLVQGSDGNFYGTTRGTVFRLTIVPEFQAVTLVTNNTLSLTWSTEAGGMYQLQCSSDLSSSNWIKLGSAVTATGATLSTTDSITNGPKRFYRLVLAP